LTFLSWPLVALVLGLGALLLGRGIAVLALRRRDGEFASAEAFRQLAKDFAAFTLATEARVAQLDEGVRKAQALNASLVQSRLPMGLRGMAGP
jgi:hypothetical protein